MRERERVLEQIKRFKRPIKRAELEEHARKYEDERERILGAREQQRAEKMDQRFDVDRYRTKTYEEVALQDLQVREERENREEMKKLLIEKKDSYAKYVRDMHLPPKSKAKEEEL